MTSSTASWSELLSAARFHKPLFVGEAGIIPNQVGGTLEARAEAFSAKIDAQFQQGIVGYLAWAYTGGPSTLNDYDIGAGDPTLDVLRLNHAPVALDDEYTVESESSTQLDVLANDSDPDDDALFVEAWENVSTGGGAVDCSAGSSCTYDPASGFSGTDSFDYAISDGRGGVAGATVTINVESTPELRIDDAQAVEGSALVFAASLSAPQSTDLAINYSTTNGTALPPPISLVEAAPSRFPPVP